MKPLRELLAHVKAHGLLRGVRIVWLKSQRTGKLARISSPVTGGPVWVRPGTSDMAIYDQIVLHPYLPRDLKVQTIIDCGSNIGLTVRYLAAAYPDARIIAVEPDESNFALLQRNCEGLPNISCVKAGIWPVTGSINLQKDGLGPSAFRTTEGTGDSPVEAVTIPLLLERFGMDRVSLLKIDIEGSELELFSCPDNSWIERIDAISIELHDSWRPGCGDAFFKAIAPWKWSFSFHGGAALCERRA
ncbi:MAG TPA: FkbM family methyltransferase [Flavobacteriales bacterium]|nr:FkbM family methyltransferase [Flavobacteriales bacterium]